MSRMDSLIAIVICFIATSFVTDHNYARFGLPEDRYNPVSAIDTVHYPEERHLANVKQLTFGGDNAEAYFSIDGQWLIFQKTNNKEGILCDQMFVGKIPT